MRRFVFLATSLFFLSFSQPAQAAGVMVESIKAHAEQHQDRRPTGENRPNRLMQPADREQLHPAQSVLAPWIQLWWDALVKR